MASNPFSDVFFIYSVSYTASGVDAGGGNAPIDGVLPTDAVPIAFKNDTDSIDVNTNLFRSKANGRWYIHCSVFGTGASANPTGLKGTVYYVIVPAAQ